MKYSACHWTWKRAQIEKYFSLFLRSSNSDGKVLIRNDFTIAIINIFKKFFIKKVSVNIS